uniref:DUF4806 domain-containing protein n=1 Tax=Knipowitschia caucasica TaxID=637954 RepID=A0AAV2L9N3_KNICA
MDRGQKRDLASGDMGDLAPGEVGDLAPGEVGDLAPGEVGDLAPGEVGDLAPGEVGDLAPGEVGDLAPGEVGDLAPGEMDDVVYDNQYLEVRQTLQRALTCSTSDLQSDEEHAGPRKRKRKTKMEAWIRGTNMELKQQVIKKLSAIGGQDHKKVTWNILACIFNDSCAQKISWKGVHGKIPFKSMALKTLILEAVKRNNLCRTITDVEIFFSLAVLHIMKMEHDSSSW